MKRDLVKTKNYERFRTAITAVERRGAPEASFLLVAGEPGYSKSIIVNKWAIEAKAVYLRAKVDWTPARFLRDLAEALGIDSAGRREEVFGRVITVVGRDSVPLIVDEVQHCLSQGARTLEAVRDISDLTETIVVLVAGEAGVQKKIDKHPQIASRIARVVEFRPADEADVRKCCDELCEIAIADDLSVEICSQSEGRMRYVINAIAFVEQDAKRNGKKKVALADFQGKTLVQKYQPRKPLGGAPSSTPR